MAAYQKRMLSNEKSRLGKVDLVTLLKKDKAWSSLPRETREHLYTLLPPANYSETPRDPDVNPLENERLRPYIEDELRRWQEDLQEGRETKKWREEAMQAGRDHVDGKFDDWKVKAREEYWGKPDESNGDGGVAEKGDESKKAEKTERVENVEVSGTKAKEENSDDGREVKESDGGSEL